MHAILNPDPNGPHGYALRAIKNVHPRNLIVLRTLDHPNIAEYTNGHRGVRPSAEGASIPAVRVIHDGGINLGTVIEDLEEDQELHDGLRFLDMDGEKQRVGNVVFTRLGELDTLRRLR